MDVVGKLAKKLTRKFEPFVSNQVNKGEKNALINVYSLQQKIHWIFFGDLGNHPRITKVHQILIYGSLTLCCR